MIRRAYPRTLIYVASLVLLLSSASSCRSDRSSYAAEGQLPPTGKIRFAAGQPAPQFKLVDLSNRQRSLSEFKSKVVMLNFWATWCAPCVAEMPAIQRLYQRFASRGFKVVSINIDSSSNLSQVKQFVAEQGIEFTVLRDEQLKVVAQYGVSGFPETLFIDADGRFLSVGDPLADGASVRFLSDRPWDSAEYVAAIELHLPPEQELPPVPE